MLFSIKRISPFSGHTELQNSFLMQERPEKPGVLCSRQQIQKAAIRLFSSISLWRRFSFHSPTSPTLSPTFFEFSPTSPTQLPTFSELSPNFTELPPSFFPPISELRRRFTRMKLSDSINSGSGSSYSAAGCLIRRPFRQAESHLRQFCVKQNHTYVKSYVKHQPYPSAASPPTIKRGGTAPERGTTSPSAQMLVAEYGHIAYKVYLTNDSNYCIIAGKKALSQQNTVGGQPLIIFQQTRGGFFDPP